MPGAVTDLNVTDLIARVRMAAFIGSPATAPDYTDAWILNELNDQQSTLFERSIVNANCGYWHHSYYFPIVAGQSKYQIPPRAAAGGLDKVDIAMDVNLNWTPLHEVKESNARLFEQGPIGQVSSFVVRGDYIQLLPTPDSSAFSIRISYYVRPSRMVVPQSGPPPAPVLGLVTAWNPTTRVATVSGLPYFQSLATPVLITSGTPIDIVRQYGWHELQVVSSTQTLSGNDFTLGTTNEWGGIQDLSTIQVHDWVRVAGETDWASIPDDYARCLVDATAVKIRTQLRDFDSAKVLSQELAGDLMRFQSLLSPRVKDSGGEDIVAPYDMYRSRGRFRTVKYP